jgi:acetyl-CoA C-acetyltransferase
VLTTPAAAATHGMPQLARVVADATAAQEPEWFTTAPVKALAKIYEKTGRGPRGWDLYEINEAFAGVTMAAIEEHGLDPAAVNVRGGAIALGHPIGCSGARVLVTLLSALRARGGGRGIATLCLGGGEAVALAIETL